MSAHELAQFAGRFHPVVVHLPIGILLLLGVLEVSTILARRNFRRLPSLDHRARTLVLASAAVTSAASALFGWCLAREGGFDPTLLQRHQILGFAVAGLALLLLVLHLAEWRRCYGVFTALTLGMVVAAGHYGGALTHGSDYLTQQVPDPLRRLLGLSGGTVAVAKRELPADPAQARIFADVVVPILEKCCTSCHGPNKANGDLRCDSLEQMARGGKHGPAFKAGDAAASLIMQRIALPLDAKEHMPPKGKPQPTDNEMLLLEWWLAAGAPQETRLAEMEMSREVALALAAEVSPALGPAPPPDRAAMLALAGELAQQLGMDIRPLTRDDPWLAVSARAKGASFGDAELVRLAPIAPAIWWLDAGQTGVTDAGLAQLGAMKQLRRLHLDRTPITDAGLARLATLKELEFLNIYGTAGTDAGLTPLTQLKNLRSLHAWQTQITPATLKTFGEERVDRRKIARWEAEIAALERKIQAEFFMADLGSQSGDTRAAQLGGMSTNNTATPASKPTSAQKKK